jgi:hypothetical protein
MLREGEEVGEMVSYKPTVLESRYRYPLLEDKADIGLNFDLVDVVSWESPWVRLEATMPPAKRKKYSDTDTASQASSSSYYQHYQKRNKNEISSNAIMAAKSGRVAAADLTLPFDQQIRAIPKAQQLPLYQRDVVASSTTSATVSSATVVPWLKRTEYMTAKEERTLAPTTAFVSESLDQLLALEQGILGSSSSSINQNDPESASSTTASHMDVDSRFDSQNEDDRLLADVLGPRTPSTARTPPPKAKNPASSLQSPFQTDATKVLRTIQRSFDAIASRTSIVHPSEILRNKKGLPPNSSQSLSRSSNSALSSSGGISKGADSHTIVEEWDVFPNDLVWPNTYLSLQSDVTLPSGDLIFLSSHTHEHSLLKPSLTEAESKLCHDTHVVPQRQKELLSLYAKPSDDQDTPSNDLVFQSHWEAEAISLRPAFDTMGSYVFVIGPTTPYDADEDEESGVAFEGESHNETVAARTRKNKSLAKAKVGTATFKNLDAHVHIKPPTAEGRALASKLKSPETVQVVPVAIPDLELHMRNLAAESLRE